jgi:hypothetical protein
MRTTSHSQSIRLLEVNFTYFEADELAEGLIYSPTLCGHRWAEVAAFARIFAYL